ncbi:hypothetical protein [Bradyrhizobium sp. OK095]|uniref:hypothetical protein n=1 Tax=Bradyrhizobium sp. OK095 TaxID=1882760 RepID=UPI0008B6DEBF|nr:hypothetical protein [Bradyrhizobium sp. OK095]SEN82162.1 hypothetical protein SAMN05443254_11210 [Bradyrhizobium sp. OK095]
MTSVSQTPSSFQSQLRANVLGWVSLRHFLPANNLRDLIRLLVDEVSEGQISFDGLFEEREIPNKPGLDGWIVRPRKTEGKLAGYLQRAIQDIVWQADGDGFPPEDGASPEQLQKARSLERALQLGTRDFGFDQREFRAPFNDQACEALLDLLRSGSACFTGKAEWSELPSTAIVRVSNLYPPLAVLLLKHIGDLCADADAWRAAEDLYRICRDRLGGEAREDWRELSEQLADVVDQSIAAAVRVNTGPEAAFALLQDSLESSSLEMRPLLKLNAPFDALSAALSVDSLALKFTENRTTLLKPPLSHESHQLNWLTVATAGSRNRHSAWRRCWAVLRRQIALGLSTESRDTMGAFAQVLLLMAEETEPHRGHPADFQLAVHLLIQAADRSHVDDIKWSERLVARFVDDGAVELVISLCGRHQGMSVERHRSAISLLTRWAEKIPQDRRQVVRVVVEFLSAQAGNGSTSFSSNRNLALAGLDALCRLAKGRPEFCRDNVASIHSAVVTRLRLQAHWNLHANAFELACLTVDMFSRDQARELVDETLSLLAALKPETQLWPVVRPALQFLLTDEVVTLANVDAELGRRIVNSIVTFGAGDRSNAAGLIQNLERFDRSLLDENVIAELRQALVERLVPSVARLNTSSNAADIRALLAIPSLSGKVGVAAALEALESVLNSVKTNRPTMGVADAYAPVLALAGRRAEFVALLGEENVDEHWNVLLKLIFDMWSIAVNKPRLLAPFSIPEPTSPNAITVHNWTYASLRFAKDLDQEDRMLQFLKGIDSPVSLRDPIDLAIATGALSANFKDQQDRNLSDEGNDSFYAGLGRRLVRVLSEEDDVAKRICSELLQQCLARGPRGLDAGVFAESLRLKIANDASRTLVQDYMQRLNSDPSMRLALWPLVAALN